MAQNTTTDVHPDLSHKLQMQICQLLALILLSVRLTCSENLKIQAIYLRAQRTYPNPSPLQCETSKHYKLS